MRKVPMLNDGVVLVVVCLIVVGGLVAWWIRVPEPSTSAAAPVIQEVVPALAPPAAKHTVRPRPAEIVPVEEPPAVIESAPVVVAAIPVVHRDPPPFPAAGQVPTGVREDSITSKYGNPAISAVTSTRGHVVETFVYAKEQGRSATLIRLQDGKVAGVYSQSLPLAPPGFSAPRRWQNVPQR